MTYNEHNPQTPDSREQPANHFTVEPMDGAPHPAAVTPPVPAPEGAQKGAGRPGWVKMACVGMACLVVGVAGTSGFFLLGGGGGNGAEAPVARQTEAAQDQEPNAETMAGQEVPVVTGETMAATDIYNLACEQVVGITATVQTGYGDQMGTGSGYILSEDGYIITNYHVVSGATGGSIQVNLGSGETYDAQYVGGDAESDVALLKIEATGLNPVTLGDSDQMTVGESIYVVGNPMGVLDYSLTGGLVSALNREIEITPDGYTTYSIDMFQIDAAVNSGNSGGPVYNSRGEVIGMVTAKSGETSSEGLGFAIPINDVKALLDDLQTHGYVKDRAFIGIVPEDVSSQVVEAYGLPSGVYVSALSAADSPAAQGGIQAKDIITHIDGQEVASSSGLRRLLKNYRAGDTAQVSVYRSGQQLELTVTFGEKPVAEDSQTQDTGLQEQYEIPEGMFPYGGGYSYGR